MSLLLALFTTAALAGGCPWAGVDEPAIRVRPGQVIVEDVAYLVGSPAEITSFQDILRACDAGEAVRPLNAWRRSAELTKSGLLWFVWMVPVTLPAQQIQRALFVKKLKKLTREDDAIVTTD